ncbi:hypothetical protein [Phytoactinopolyspora halotolerans]|nr:hypothetical protein [Phytoactinopolyspora halotolerans]
MPAIAGVDRENRASPTIRTGGVVKIAVIYETSFHVSSRSQEV